MCECIITTSSSPPPPVDVPGRWLGSGRGQLDRWDMRMRRGWGWGGEGVFCELQQFSLGHHGSAHWQLVHPCCMCVCVHVCFRSVEMSLERIAAADKYQVVTRYTYFRKVQESKIILLVSLCKCRKPMQSVVWQLLGPGNTCCIN